MSGNTLPGVTDEDQIGRLVARFYDRVRADEELGPIFAEAVEDWDRHLDTLRDFWSSVMLTSGRYKGNPLAVHMKLPIAPALFDRWLALWSETAEDVAGPEVAARFREKASRIAESLKLGLFYRPDRGPS